MDACLELASPLGTVVVIGDYGPARASFPWTTLLHREVSLIGSNASAGAWPEALRLAPRLPIAGLVSRRLSAERFAEGVALVRGRDPSAIKIVLVW